jgi:hypothetical protein
MRRVNITCETNASLRALSVFCLFLLLISFSPLVVRHFAADVKRAEELERRIRFLESQLAARSFRLNRGESVDVEMNELTTLELLEARVIDRLHCLCFLKKISFP